jgi:molecular chaperone GrpE
VAPDTEDKPVRTEAAEIDRLKAENESLRDRLLRALADAENTRRRIEDRLADARQFSIADFARELLIVVDNLQRTIESAQTTGPVPNEALLEGVQATLRLFVNTLQRFGVYRIEALGQHFDPKFHEAMMVVDDQSKPAGTIVRVVDQGYMIHDRLLRPARVVVTRSRKQSPPVPDDDDTELGSEWGSNWVY